MPYSEHRKILQTLKKYEAQLPAIVSEMGGIGYNHFVRSFANQGFTDSTLEKWKPRKRDSRLERGKPNRAILVKSGRLRRSLRRQKLGKYGVVILTDVPYAKIHNDGLMGRAWGKYPFKMPKRQFMGPSRIMNDKISRMIDRSIKKVFR